MNQSSIAPKTNLINPKKEMINFLVQGAINSSHKEQSSIQSKGIGSQESIDAVISVIAMPINDLTLSRPEPS